MITADFRRACYDSDRYHDGAFGHLQTVRTIDEIDRIREEDEREQAEQAIEDRE